MITTLVRYFDGYCRYFSDALQDETFCYKLVQSFRVTCLFTGQYDTREYGTIAGVIFST